MVYVTVSVDPVFGEASGVICAVYSRLMFPAAVGPIDVTKSASVVVNST
jgi:hypothetical protein